MNPRLLATIRWASLFFVLPFIVLHGERTKAPVEHLSPAGRKYAAKFGDSKKADPGPGFRALSPNEEKFLAWWPHLRYSDREKWLGRLEPLDRDFFYTRLNAAFDGRDKEFKESRTKILKRLDELKKESESFVFSQNSQLEQRLKDAIDESIATRSKLRKQMSQERSIRSPLELIQSLQESFQKIRGVYSELKRTDYPIGSLGTRLSFEQNASLLDSFRLQWNAEDHQAASSHLSQLKTRADRKGFISELPTILKTAPPHLEPPLRATGLWMMLRDSYADEKIRDTVYDFASLSPDRRATFASAFVVKAVREGKAESFFSILERARSAIERRFGKENDDLKEGIEHLNISVGSVFEALMKSMRGTIGEVEKSGTTKERQENWKRLVQQARQIRDTNLLSTVLTLSQGKALGEGAPPPSTARHFAELLQRWTAEFNLTGALAQANPPKLIPYTASETKQQYMIVPGSEKVWSKDKFEAAVHDRINGFYDLVQLRADILNKSTDTVGGRLVRWGSAIAEVYGLYKEGRTSYARLSRELDKACLDTIDQLKDHFGLEGLKLKSKEGKETTLSDHLRMVLHQQNKRDNEKLQDVRDAAWGEFMAASAAALALPITLFAAPTIITAVGVAKVIVVATGIGAGIGGGHSIAIQLARIEDAKRLGKQPPDFSWTDVGKGIAIGAAVGFGAGVLTAAGPALAGMGGIGATLAPYVSTTAFVGVNTSMAFFAGHASGDAVTHYLNDETEQAKVQAATAIIGFGLFAVNMLSANGSASTGSRAVEETVTKPGTPHRADPPEFPKASTGPRAIEVSRPTNTTPQKAELSELQMASTGPRAVEVPRPTNTTPQKAELSELQMASTGPRAVEVPRPTNTTPQSAASRVLRDVQQIRSGRTQTTPQKADSSELLMTPLRIRVSEPTGGQGTLPLPKGGGDIEAIRPTSAPKHPRPVPIPKEPLPRGSDEFAEKKFGDGKHLELPEPNQNSDRPLKYAPLPGAEVRPKEGHVLDEKEVLRSLGTSLSPEEKESLRRVREEMEKYRWYHPPDWFRERELLKKRLAEEKLSPKLADQLLWIVRFEEDGDASGGLIVKGGGSSAGGKFSASESTLLSANPSLNRSPLGESDGQRLERARLLLERPLSPAERDAILEAHRATELRKKVEILRPMFSLRQRRILLENEVCGGGNSVSERHWSNIPTSLDLPPRPNTRERAPNYYRMIGVNEHATAVEIERAVEDLKTQLEQQRKQLGTILLPARWHDIELRAQNLETIGETLLNTQRREAYNRDIHRLDPPKRFQVTIRNLTAEDGNVGEDLSIASMVGGGTGEGGSTFLLNQNDLPIIIGRALPNVRPDYRPPYLAPGYRLTSTQRRGPAPLNLGVSQISRAHFMLQWTETGVMFVNGVPSGDGTIQAPKNGTRAPTATGEWGQMDRGERRFLSAQGGRLELELPGGTRIEIEVSESAPIVPNLRPF